MPPFSGNSKKPRMGGIATFMNNGTDGSLCDFLSRISSYLLSIDKESFVIVYGSDYF